MSRHYSIRLITENDAPQVLDIYRPYVENTIISFEYEVPTATEFLERIRTNTSKYPWLVCLHHDKIIGYAYGSTHRYRTAYQWSPESTIYLSPEFHGKGIARILYETLFSLLRLQGYFNVFAGVGLPNEKSVAFHKAVGFEDIGIFRNVGYKLGGWHNTHWFQLALQELIKEPLVPQKIEEIIGTNSFKQIMADANTRIETI